MMAALAGEASAAKRAVAPFTVSVKFSNYQKLGSDGFLVKTIRVRGRDVRPGRLRVACSRKFCGSLYRNSKPRRTSRPRVIRYSNVRWVVSKRRHFRVTLLPRTAARVGLFADVFSPDEYNRGFTVGRVGCVKKSGRTTACPPGIKLPAITRRSAPTQAPVYPGGAELAVVGRGAGKLTLFTRGKDGACWWRDYEPGVGWSAWRSLGGPIQGAPSAVYRSGGLDLFATSDNGTADGSLLTIRRSPDGEWGQWRDLGGLAVGGPAAASLASDRIDLFARSANNSLLHRSSVDGSSWGAWAAVGATKIYSSPSAVKAAGSGNIYVAFRSQTGSIWHRKMTSNLAWEPSVELGGTTDASPAITQGRPGHLALFAVDVNRKIGIREYAETWANWATLSVGTQTFQGSPTAGSWGAEHMMIAARDLQSTIHTREFAAGSWSAWRTLGN